MTVHETEVHVQVYHNPNRLTDSHVARVDAARNIISKRFPNWAPIRRSLDPDVHQKTVSLHRQHIDAFQFRVPMFEESEVVVIERYLKVCNVTNTVNQRYHFYISSI